jgi:hypothetical protein
MKKGSCSLLGGLFLLAILVWAGQAFADSIAFDSSSSFGGNGVSLTWAHTVGSGSNRILIVGVSIHTTGSINSVTYAGVNLTKVGSISNIGVISSELWYLVNPASGTHDVIVTASESVLNLAAGGMSYTGVDQANPLGTYASATGFSNAMSVDVSSAVNELVVDSVAVWTGLVAAPSAGAGQTQRWNVYQNSASGAGSDEPGAATVTMSWSTTGIRYWAIGGVSLKPAAQAGGPTSTLIRNAVIRNAVIR